MAKYAEWYSVELDGYLKGRISDVQRFEATKEIANHFAEHVDELVAKGMDPLEAEKAAIKSYGNPKQAAISLLRKGKFPFVGKIFVLVGCLAIFVLSSFIGILFQGVFLQRSSLYAQVNALGVLAISIATISISLVTGIFMTQRLPYKPMLTAWFAGVIVVAGAFYINRDVPYSGIPVRQFPTVLEAWKGEQAKTAELGKVIQKIYGSCKPEYTDGKLKISDQARAEFIVKTEAPKLLQIASKTVYLDGKLSAGYLAPVEDKYQYWDNTVGPDPVLRWFPMREQLHLAYYKTASEAVIAWSNETNRDSTISPTMGRLAGEQSEYIYQAEQIVGMSSLGLFALTVGPFTGISLIITIMMILIAWLLVNIPNFTVRTSFRRRFA